MLPVSSPSSSFSSSVPPSTQLPASSPSTPCHNTISSDQLTPVHSHTSDKSVSGRLASCHHLHSPPTSPMGQVISRPQVSTTFPPSSTPSCLAGSSSSGNRFKRALVGRRKRSEGIPPSSVSSPTIGKSKELVPNNGLCGSVHSAPSRQLGAKQLTLQLASHVFSKKQSGSAPSSPVVLPPPLPPKQGIHQPIPRPAPLHTNVDKRLSVLTTSNTSIAPALDYIRRTDELTDLEHDRKDVERIESKEIRRKSDSTLSHHTIRPTLGSKTPRPVSLAESLRSTHTIVPTNKRLSTLVTDVEYITPEEEGERVGEGGDFLTMSSLHGHLVSPSSSPKMRDRRSQSLSFGPPLSLMASAPTAAQASISLDAIPCTASRSVSGECGKASVDVSACSVRTTPHTGPDVRSRAKVERTLPELPQSSPRSSTPTAPNSGLPSFRQTAISMTSGFAPAAGLARRAVEKMGRVWGSKGASSSPLVTSAVMPSPLPIGLVSRANSGHSEPANRARHNKHAPQTPSVSSTGSSLSDYEGPQLGRCLRGPLGMPSSGAGIGGLVFGRDLRACVSDTAVEVVRSMLHGSGVETDRQTGTTSMQSRPSASLERRYLPALIVRCTQHILNWGVQEQGLFRVSGRSSHIAKLRTEFDTGADFDIVQSHPGDLDPHAVASIFKAYLRELPEPILTHDLIPFFDAVMASERFSSHAQESPPNSMDIQTHIRKPPSLSTLAMPNFSGVPPSESLRGALSSLIARLPQENRDLLLTVTEVINSTARRSQETKMPLSNLLLVLCPSLNMNPALLQALCESGDIWDGVGSVMGDSVASIADQLPLHGSDRSSVALGDAPTVGDDDKLVRPLPTLPVDGSPSDSPATGNNLVVHCASTLELACELDHPVHFESSRGLSSSSMGNSCSISPLLPDRRSATPNSMNFRVANSHSPPSLSSSVESSSVPSLSSDSPVRSTKNLPLVNDLSSLQSPTLVHSPVVADSIVLPLPSSKTASQSLFQFPGMVENIRKSPLSHKKSFSSTTSGDVLTGSVALRARRLKKPSLHLLFSKPSTSPVSTTPNSQSPAHGSATVLVQHETASKSSLASESSPESMVTAPQSSRFSYPPVLNTSIDESSISLELGIHDEEVHATSVGRNQQAHVQVPSTPETTNTRAHRDPSHQTIQGGCCHLDLPLPKGDEYGETWTQSVLLAAGEPSW